MRLFAHSIRYRSLRGPDSVVGEGHQLTRSPPVSACYPGADEVAKRSSEERLAEGTVSAQIRNALALVEPLADIDGVELRCHHTTLHNSVFRFDDEMIVNMHVYGQPGAYAPAMHLLRLAGGDLFDT